MHVEPSLDRVSLKHRTGSSVEILFYGATIISWKSAEIRDPQPLERLFVSSKAVLDGSKPVRGGIPIVFPCFGAPLHPEHVKLSQHGFGRSELWSWDGAIIECDGDVSVRLTLEPTERITAVYNKSFQLIYTVTLAQYKLSTDLYVKNTSTSFPPDVLEFQALFHNYIRAPSDQALITPLQHLAYYDKTETTEQGRITPKVETRAEVDVKTFTDFVYEDAPQDYEVTWPGGGVTIRSKNLKDVVVWNPQEQGTKIVDMEDGGWKRYICVEPGFVRGFVKLEPGRTWVAQQVLSLVQEERRMK